jgi:hypothetical protein
MKKRFFILSVSTLFTVLSFAQKSDIDPSVSQGGVVNRRPFKTELPAADKADSYEIKAIGSVTFTVSNTADGSTNSYNHALRININLVMTDSKVGNFQLVFYGDKEAVPYAVFRQEGAIAIFYPASLYEEIKDKLEASLAARKKVLIKVTEKTTGFREGVLSF